MARRRRSLLKNPTGVPGVPGASPPAPSPVEPEDAPAPESAEETAAAEPEAPPDAAPASDEPSYVSYEEPEEPVAPDPEPPVASDGPSYVTFDDPPDEESEEEPREGVEKVVESGYVETGHAASDTTDSGWGDSVWNSSAPRPSPARPSALEARRQRMNLDSSPRPEPGASQDPGPSPFAEDEMSDAVAGFFGGDVDENDEPPTEEVPSAVLEDPAQNYQAPMNVPEPPPIPGLVDRFTPAPVARTEVGGMQGQSRPSYLPTPTPAPQVRRPPPPAAPTYDDLDEDDESDAVAAGGLSSRELMLPAAVGGGFALVVGAVLAVLWMLAGPSTGPDPATAPANAPAAVQPAPAPAPAPAPPVEEPAPEEEAPAEDAAGEAEPEAATPEASAPAAKAPAPAPKKAAPAPRKTPAKAVSAGSDGDVGTLKIRSNRRVLVIVNGSPVGYSPLDLPKPPGQYTVSAALAGQPDTEQILQVELGGGAVEPVEFEF